MELTAPIAENDWIILPPYIPHAVLIGSDSPIWQANTIEHNLVIWNSIKKRIRLNIAYADESHPLQLQTIVVPTMREGIMYKIVMIFECILLCACRRIGG